ncbi:hypothetical protein [Streptomyces marianii]|uniref:Uncharacterized protein n=1 Tax=Streptomyces marianii TaxID=1817406 RepID=A0A5R9DVP1_9ACTN|nr:hypothetical protein [Streptomyces marianii]TLQ39193.1 hypothetical protein FEF34_37975 [Streptomyces marianii]
MPILQSPMGDRDGRVLAHAADRTLFAVTEYGAVRYYTDRLGPGAPALHTADVVYRCAERGWIAQDEDGQGLTITEAGRSALALYQRYVKQRDELPHSITRNPMRGEPHDPREPVRILHDARTGQEIRPGDRIADPAGEMITYLGTSMTRAGDDGPWQPGGLLRVLYDGGVPWVFLPSQVGAAFDDDSE